MKKVLFLVLLIGVLHSINAQNTSNVEITNNDVKIASGSNGKAYYNDKEIATKDTVELMPTEEVLTGEKINGRPVYVKCIRGSLTAGQSVQLTLSSIMNCWVDISNSFVFVASNMESKNLVADLDNSWCKFYISSSTSNSVCYTLTSKLSGGAPLVYFLRVKYSKE